MPRTKREAQALEIRALFHLPLKSACRQLGVCPSVLKRMCRDLGITRWPHRKIRSLDARLAKMAALKPRSKEESLAVKRSVGCLRLIRDNLLEDPNVRVPFKQLRTLLPARLQQELEDMPDEPSDDNMSDEEQPPTHTAQRGAVASDHDDHWHHASQQGRSYATRRRTALMANSAHQEALDSDEFGEDGEWLSPTSSVSSLSSRGSPAFDLDSPRRKEYDDDDEEEDDDDHHHPNIWPEPALLAVAAAGLVGLGRTVDGLYHDDQLLLDHQPKHDAGKMSIAFLTA